jgi:hypothetical protein
MSVAAGTESKDSPPAIVESCRRSCTSCGEPLNERHSPKLRPFSGICAPASWLDESIGNWDRDLSRRRNASYFRARLLPDKFLDIRRVWFPA